MPFFCSFLCIFSVHTTKLPYLSLSERWRRNVFKLVETCQNVSKCVETCRKLLFLSWPILISRKSFLHYHSKAFSFTIRKRKNKTPQAFILVILENEMYKKMKRIFFIIIIITYSWFLSLQLALIVTNKWKKNMS